MVDARTELDLNRLLSAKELGGTWCIGTAGNLETLEDAFLQITDLPDALARQLAERIVATHNAAYDSRFGDHAELIENLHEAIERESSALAHNLANEYTLAALTAARDQILALAARVKEQAAAIEHLEFALAYLGSCTAATAEGLLSRKSTPKSEIARHRRICELLLRALRGEDISSALSASSIIGTERRLEKVIAELPNDR